MLFLNTWAKQIDILRADFIGIYLNLAAIAHFIFLLVFTLLLFAYFYLIGRHIRQLLFRFTEGWQEGPYIDVALGYISVCFGLVLLGMVSFFTPVVLSTYFLLTAVLALVPIGQLSEEIKTLRDVFSNIRQVFATNLWPSISVAALLFVSFLRLLPPEVGADAMAYHTTLPKLYLYYHTLLINPALHVEPSTIPQLGEMPYVIALFFHMLDASRFIHFGFYVLSVLLLLSATFTKRDAAYAPYAALLLICSPMAIHIVSSAYSDFQQVLCFLLAIFVLVHMPRLSLRGVLLSGILIGGALATKMFALAYLPSFVVYISWRMGQDHQLTIKRLCFYLVSFVGVSLILPLPWYVRAYRLFGNPFQNYFYYDLTSPAPNLVNEANLFAQVFSWQHKLQVAGHTIIFDLSLLSTLAILGILLRPLAVLKTIKTWAVTPFIVIFIAIYLFLPSELYAGRYLIPWYILVAVLLAPGIFQLASRRGFARLLLGTSVCLLILYFAANALIILPYGLGWANRHNFITRILALNHNAYYDFGYRFSPFIRDDEVIATYNIEGFYYGNFIPNNVYAFLQTDNKSLSQLRRQGVVKLLIRGGDISWFCKNLSISDCKVGSVRLLASYPPAQQYLYVLAQTH